MARLKYSILSLPKQLRGLAASFFECYHLSAQIRFILEWFIEELKFTWLEAIGLRPTPLRNPLCVSLTNLSALIKDNFI